MQRLENRIRSFSAGGGGVTGGTGVGWPLDSPRSEQMAEAGFYYLGRGDDVRCVYCKVEMDSWGRDDDPFTRHFKYAPQCAFMRSRAGVVKFEPVNAMYSDRSARLESFTELGWPRGMPQTPEDLADAGFFYTGQGDRTKCFYCDGGVRDWMPEDEPWSEHALHFNRCVYVRLVKGPQFVERVEFMHSEATEEEEVGGGAAAESAIEVVDETKVCRLCCTFERNVAYVPCGHVYSCVVCSSSLVRCPVCRIMIDRTLRLYFS